MEAVPVPECNQEGLLYCKPETTRHVCPKMIGGYVGVVALHQKEVFSLDASPIA